MRQAAQPLGYRFPAIGIMTVSVHNPDEYMASLRTIIAQGRKRIGFLIGAGAPAGMARGDGAYPLVPAVSGLTALVLKAIEADYGAVISALKQDLKHHDIETILSRIRSLAKVIGTTKVYDLDGDGFEVLGERICAEIGIVVDARLPAGTSAYADLVSWITGTARPSAIEIFTTNYDLLLEEAFEAVRAPYFDGFTGGREPFFDPVSIANNDLPGRWTRLWKLHGSLGWCKGERGEVIRSGKSSATHLVFPEHLKYDQTQKAPYSALLDRLRSFLSTDDTLLLAIGFSFSDSHVAARISEGLASNPSASVFAFQFKPLEAEGFAARLATQLSNFSLYARDKAIMNGVPGPWLLPDDLPSKDWGPIRASYWGQTDNNAPPHFLLGAIEPFARFLASSRSGQAFSAPPVEISAAPAGAAA